MLYVAYFTGVLWFSLTSDLRPLTSELCLSRPLPSGFPASKPPCPMLIPIDKLIQIK